MSKYLSLTNLSLFLLLFLCNCTSKPDQTGIIEMVSINGKEIPKLHLEKIADSATTVKLSELFADYRIIPLETKKECLIMNTRVGFTDHSILIGTQSGSDQFRVLEFDFTGRYIQEFGSWGKGPGEHTGYSADELTFDPRCGQILISWNDDNQAQLFGSDGKFHGSVKIPIGHTHELKKYNDSVWMTPGFIAGNPEYKKDSLRLIMYRSDGSVVKVWPRTRFPEQSSGGYAALPWNASLYKYKDRWHLYSPGDDTVYRIGLDRLDPEAILNLGIKGRTYVKLENPQAPGRPGQDGYRG